MKTLNGKVAIVTGSSRGLGAAIAKQLADDGAAVVVNYSWSRSEAEEVVGEIVAGGGRAVAIQANLADAGDVGRLFQETSAVFGRLDVLVNNAGLHLAARLEEITPEHFHLHFNLNVLGVILATQTALNYFGPEGGCVINVSSAMSTGSAPGTAVYSSTKSAVDGLTRTFARELQPRGIRVNAVNPGIVETEGLEESGLLSYGEYWQSVIATESRVMPGEIAPVVSFLASPRSGWMTGECVRVNGENR